MILWRFLAGSQRRQGPLQLVSLTAQVGQGAGQPDSPGRAGSRTGLDFPNFPKQGWPSPIKPAAALVVPKVHVLPGHPYYLLYDVQAAEDSHVCVTPRAPSWVSSGGDGGVSGCGKTSPVTGGPRFPVTLETPVKHWGQWGGP